MTDTDTNLLSDTMSPGPQRDVAHDVDMEQEPQAVVLLPSGSVEEDGPKQANPEEELLGTIPGSAKDTDGESSQARARAALRASNRGKRRADVVYQDTMDSYDADAWGMDANSMRWVQDSGLAGMGYEYSHMRVIPTSPSSFLRPGSRFTGTQQSERQRYDVKVEIKHVDMRESFLCGYLKIQGMCMISLLSPLRSCANTPDRTNRRTSDLDDILRG